MSKFTLSKSAKKVLSYFISILMIAIFVIPFFVQAQEGGTGGGGEGGTGGGKGGGSSQTIIIENPFKQDTIKGLIETIVNDILMPIGGVIAVMMIMYAGFLYVTARGDSGQITKAHDALKYAVIGAAILLGAWVISQAIGNTIDQLKK
jgi:hypothetical protein